MDDIIMWSTPTKYDLDTSLKTPGEEEGVLGNTKYRQIMDDVLQYFTELDTIISVCEQRVHTIPSSLRDIRCGVTEIERAWAYSVALMDYIEKYHPLITGKTAQSIEPVALASSSHVMGAFVWNPQDALVLFRARIPVYYIRPYSEASGQRVKQAVKLSRIT
ncbi:hypothetical protein MPER_03097, partial [Moniliophthora perniciosa FA553]